MFDSKRFVNSFVVSSLALAVLTACGGSKKEEPIAVTPPVAIAPTAQNDSATSVNNAVIDIDVLANDNAGSGDSLKLTAVTSARLGEVTIVDNKIRYTPSETFLGSDSFEYTITNSSGTATASVTVAGHQSLTLSGRVIDSPIADASVKVVINGETFSATADSQGFYTLSVLLTSLVGDEVIRVIAQGAEKNNQGFVTLSSLTDSAKNLLALRQTDNAVSNDEFSALKLTQITTARDLLIQQISGGKTLTPTELAEADVSLDVDLLISTAAAIKLLVDNPAFSLPEGFENIEQFVLDTSAFTSFVAAASEGENSPLSQARAATLSDPEIMPAVKPFSGNFVLIDDTPAFMPARTYENVRFTDSSIVFVNHSDQSKSFLPVEKAISISGNVIDIIDPEKSGHQERNAFLYFASYVPDEASRDIWMANNCPTQIQIRTQYGFSKLRVMEKADNYFVAEISTYNSRIPVSAACAGIEPQTISSTGSFVGRFVNESSLTPSLLEFDLSQSRQWVLPDVRGGMFDSDLYTLNENGTFTTLTNTYEGSNLSWSLSEDKKTLTLKEKNTGGSNEFFQMDLQISRALDSALVLFAVHTNEKPKARVSSLRPGLAVAGEGVVDLLTASKDASKIILSSVNSRNKEWQGRQRLPGGWFGWTLTSDTDAISPSFLCDGEGNFVGESCDGKFARENRNISSGSWSVKDNALHIERGSAAFYESGACVLGEPCNLRVIVPLYEKEGVVTGYEYNIIMRNQYQIMPRVMFWTLQDLPPLEE